MNKNPQDQEAVISVLLSTIEKLREELRDSNEAISHYQDVERTLLKNQGLTGEEVEYVNPSNTPPCHDELHEWAKVNLLPQEDAETQLRFGRGEESYDEDYILDRWKLAEFGHRTINWKRKHG